MFFLRLNNLFQIPYISLLQYEFYDFVDLFCHLQRLGHFSPFQGPKMPKNDCFEKNKIEEEKNVFNRLNNLFQISNIYYLQYEFYDFVNLFGHLQGFWPIFTVLVIFTFFNIVNNTFLQTPSRFQRFNTSTKKNSYQIKSPDQRL